MRAVRRPQKTTISNRWISSSFTPLVARVVGVGADVSVGIADFKKNLIRSLMGSFAAHERTFRSDSH